MRPVKSLRMVFEIFHDMLNIFIAGFLGCKHGRIASACFTISDKIPVPSWGMRCVPTLFFVFTHRVLEQLGSAVVLNDFPRRLSAGQALLELTRREMDHSRGSIQTFPWRGFLGSFLSVSFTG